MFDLDGFLRRLGAGAGGVFLGLLVLVRGVSSLLWLRELGPAGRRQALALLGATGLPLIVAIVGIAARAGERSGATSEHRSIGAGMISVLVFPLLAIRIVGREGGAPTLYGQGTPAR